ncbi:MAG: hypothetical protein QF444_03260 [Phycisphaerales bacterium]|jgi:hypothetical protein|nr:hypothetical protein [Phycisphaerales bacterium]MDP6693321.1 hypothetical protein [Phycisphaerales bacterium]
MAKQRILACPLCGETQYEQSECKKCGSALDADGLLLAESSIGPWFIRDEDNPFSPGMTYDILISKIREESVQPYSLVRGPTTRQLWKVAKYVPGIAHLLGRCHKCKAHVDPKNRSCSDCGEAFGGFRDRNNMGLDQGDPPKVELEGVSSFLRDTAIYDTQSDQIQLFGGPAEQRSTETQNASSTQEVPVTVDGPGTPAFHSLQRRLDDAKRINRILMVALCITGLVLVLALVKIFNA